MMTDKDQRGKPGKPKAGPKPKATGNPVVPSTPLPDTAPAPVASPLPAVGSTLVGTGGTLPPMSARAAKPAGDTPAGDRPAPARPTTTAAPETPKAEAPKAGAPKTETPKTETPKAKAPATAPATETGPAPAASPPPAAPPTTPSAAKAPPPARRGGFWPLFLGGVVAAGLGAGATWWAIPHLPEGWRPLPVAAPEPAEPPDLQALKDEILAELPVDPTPAIDEAALAEAVAAALHDAQPGIEATAREAAADELTRRLAEAGAEAPAGTETAEALAATVQAQGERIEALDRQLADLAAAPAPTAPASEPTAEAANGSNSRAAAGAALEALQAEVAALETRLADLAARPAGATTESVDALAAKLDAAEAQLAALPQRLDTLESRQAGLSAAARLAEALRGGDAESVAAAAEALGAAGQDDLAQLAQNLPTLGALQSGFDRAARDALAATRRGESSIGAFLATQTNARSVAPREGDDPDAIQSRAGAAVEAGDIAAALRELDAMPEAGRAAMADWLARAETWVGAQDALSQITQPATESE